MFADAQLDEARFAELTDGIAHSIASSANSPQADAQVRCFVDAFGVLGYLGHLELVPHGKGSPVGEEAGRSPGWSIPAGTSAWSMAGRASWVKVRPGRSSLSRNWLQIAV